MREQQSDLTDVVRDALADKGMDESMTGFIVQYIYGDSRLMELLDFVVAMAIKNSNLGGSK